MSLASRHPFVDGNKRVAFVTMAVFLGLNGLAIEAPEGEVVDGRCWPWPAASSTRRALADWLRTRLADRAKGGSG